jgi:hypothetical protein
VAYPPSKGGIVTCGWRPGTQKARKRIGSAGVELIVFELSVDWLQYEVTAPWFAGRSVDQKFIPAEPSSTSGGFFHLSNEI